MTEAQDARLEALRFEGLTDLSYWRRFAAMMSIAVVIATVGLYRNSGAVVIAAMLIAPLMTPILGMAVSILMGWTKRTLILMGAVALATVGTVCLAYIILFIADAPKGVVVAREVIARTDPGLEELIVALAAGVAGAYTQMRREDVNLLPGVAIGVSLVPPLAASGILLYFEDIGGAWEAMLLYLTNLVAIVLAACCVFLALGMRPAMKERGYKKRFGIGAFITLLAMVLLCLQLGSVTIQRFQEGHDEERVAAAVRTWAGDQPVETIRVNVLKNTAVKTVEVWIVVDVPLSLAHEVRSPRDSLPEELTASGETLRQAIEDVLGSDADIVLRFQIRYGGLVDLRTGLEIGTAPVEPAEESESEPE